MTYTFIKIYEMNTIVTVFETVAKDEHDAMRKYLLEHDMNDYDLMAINGEWV